MRAHGSYLVFSSPIEPNMLGGHEQLVERTRALQCDPDRSDRIHCDTVWPILPCNLLKLSVKIVAQDKASGLLRLRRCGNDSTPASPLVM